MSLRVFRQISWANLHIFCIRNEAGGTSGGRVREIPVAAISAERYGSVNSLACVILHIFSQHCESWQRQPCYLAAKCLPLSVINYCESPLNLPKLGRKMPDLNNLFWDTYFKKIFFLSGVPGEAREMQQMAEETLRWEQFWKSSIGSVDD